MNAPIALAHEFVKSIPGKLEERTLYVSMEYATVTHKCCCGCGNEVVTPLTPTDWKLTYDGESISLHPPIGNWNFPCQSHYWIRNSTVKWADQWSREQIEAGRTFDRRAKKEYYTTEYSPPDGEKPVITERAPNGAPRGSLWTRIVSWWSR
jgi:hypothetical protein